MSHDTSRHMVTHSITDLPDKAVAISVVEVVEYLDENGNRVYAYRHAGSSNLSTTVGLLELAKQNLISRADFG